MTEGRWSSNFEGVDLTRSSDNSIVDVVAKNATVEYEDESKHFLDDAVPHPVDPTTNIFPNISPDVIHKNKTEKVSSLERKMFSLNKFTSEHSINSYHKSGLYNDLNILKTSVAPNLSNPNEEMELTKEIKSKVRAMERRNLDLIIEVETLKTELDRQRRFSNDNKEEMRLKLNDKHDEIKILKKFNLDLQKTVEDINKKLQEKTIKLGEYEACYKSLQGDYNTAITERDQLVSDLDLVKSQSMNAARDCRLKDQQLSYNELSLCKFESENEILKEKLKFSENTVKELSAKIEAMKSDVEQLKTSHKGEVEQMKRKIGSFRSEMESSIMAHNGLTIKHASTMKRLSSLENKNINLHKKVDELVETEQRLLKQLDEAKFNGKVAWDEVATIRKELSNMHNKLNKKEEECTQIENKLKDESSVTKQVKDERDQFEKIVDELKKENHNLISEKESSEVKLITFENSSEILKKDNFQLAEEVKALKYTEKKLRQQLLDLEKREASNEAKLVNVEALNEILCSIYRNLQKENSWPKDNPNLPDFWYKEDGWSRKSDVIGKLSQLEINKAENEGRISSLLAMLSNYRDAFHTMYASLDGRPLPHFEYVQKPASLTPEAKKCDVFQRFVEFENLHRNVKMTYEEKCVLLRRQESLLQKEVEHLENALLVSRKNELKLKVQLDSQINGSNISQKYQTPSKASKLQENILELETQERRLKRRINELLLVEEYLVKNTNSFKNNSNGGTEYFKRLPSERDLPQAHPRARTIRFQDEFKPLKHPLDWINLHATVHDDFYQEAFMFERNRQLKNNEISLIKKLTSTEEECRKCQDKIVEDQQTIQQMDLHCRQLEISEKSLKQQLEFAEERESKLARKVCDLTEKVAGLETSLRNSIAREETLRVEVSNFRAREDELQMQLTHAYDELQDRTVEDASQKKRIREIEDIICKLESKVSTSKLVEEQLMTALEASKDNEVNLKDKLVSKKNLLKSSKRDLETKAEECAKLEQSEALLKKEVQDKNEELNMMEERLRDLEKNNRDMNAQCDALLKILEHHKQEFQAKLVEKQLEIDGVHKSCFDIKREFIEKEKENEILNQNISELRFSNVQLKDSLDDLEQKMSNSKLRSSELDFNLNASVEYGRRLNDELKVVNENLLSSERNVELLKEELVSEKNKVTHLERENENLRVDLKVIKEENSSLEENVKHLNFKYKNKDAEAFRREEQLQEELNSASKREYELRKKNKQLEEMNHMKTIETLKNLNYNSKEVQIDLTIKSIFLKLTPGDILFLIENHRDFKRATNLLSTKYPHMYKDFMADTKALLGGKKWLEDKMLTETKDDAEYLKRESFFDTPTQKLKSNPIYGNGLEFDQNIDTDENATDQDLSESALSPIPVTSQPAKTFPLQFAPSFHQTSQIGQAFHKFWPMPINEVKQDMQTRNVEKEETKSTKKATYQEEKTTYVRSRHLSTPSAPLFKTSYVDNQSLSPKTGTAKNSVKFSKSPPWKTAVIEPKKQLLILKDSPIDCDNDEYNVGSESSLIKEVEVQDVFEENIVQKRIALFENRVTR